MQPSIGTAPQWSRFAHQQNYRNSLAVRFFQYGLKFLARFREKPFLEYQNGTVIHPEELKTNSGEYFLAGNYTHFVLTMLEMNLKVSN